MTLHARLSDFKEEEYYIFNILLWLESNIHKSLMKGVTVTFNTIQVKVWKYDGSDSVCCRSDDADRIPTKKGFNYVLQPNTLSQQ